MCEPSISRRERKKQETRQRLLEAAWALFAEQGYESTTVEQITERADVAKGTLFNYFETKETLLAEVMTWRTELLGDRVLSAETPPPSAVARIKLVMEAMTNEFSPEREFARHLFMARIAAPVKHASAHRLGSLIYDLTVQGQADGEIRADLDGGLVARLLMTCFFHTFMQWCHAADAFPLQQKLFGAVDALFSGLGGPNWRVE